MENKETVSNDIHPLSISLHTNQRKKQRKRLNKLCFLQLLNHSFFIWIVISQIEWLTTTVRLNNS